MMEKLVVDADGKVTSPQHVLERRGLRPGDELTLVEAAGGCWSTNTASSR